MSFTVSERVFERGPRDTNLRLTMLVIANRTDDQGLTLPAFRGLREVSDRTCKSLRQAMRNLRRLESDGWITVERRAVLRPGEKGAQNRYRISLEKLGAGCDTALSHPRYPAHDAAMSRDSRPVCDTAMSPGKGEVRDISKTNHVTSGDVVCDTAVSSHNRKNIERNYNSEALAIASRIASTERALQSEPVALAFAKAIESELETGISLEDAGKAPLLQMRRYIAARDSGKFEIRSWSIVNFLAGGHWRDEQSWHWKPEYRPEPKMRYCDPATLYPGPEYQRRAEGA